jgi:hypothetical protein
MPFGLKEAQDAEEASQGPKRVAKLRQVDVLVSQGQNIVDAIRQIGVSSLAFRFLKRQKYFGTGLFRSLMAYFESVSGLF